MTENELNARLKSEAETAITNRTLKKAVMSRPRSKENVKTVLTAFEKLGDIFFKSEAFMKDGKNIQKILTKAEALDFISRSAPKEYKQINLIAEGQAFEVIISDKGKFRFTGSLEGAKPVSLALSQDKKKSYIITPETDGEFLYELGITDKTGRIHDKKQSKFRQINKFLEQIEAVLPSLLKEGTLHICDLCCGKSYLTFAVYRYFTHHRGRDVDMLGIDLKKDVIEYCSSVAARLGYGGMRFECGDVSAFSPDTPPDLMISLHACDVATDFALAGAVKSGAKVILSTPCCQHQFNSEMRCDTLSFLTEHSILKQKLAAAATDALRAKLLEIYGYKVTVCELIDPEETPKNVLIRAIKIKRGSDIKALTEQYKNACSLLGVTPMLAKLLPLPDNLPKEIPLQKRKKG